MAWLALDTSTDIASFAIKVNNKVYTQELTGMTTHAEKSLPAIDALFNEAGIHLSDMSGVILGQGPGSFTGLRVASSIAKGLAYPRQIPVYMLSNLRVIAWMASQVFPNTAILSVIDARMQQVYWAYYPDVLAEAQEHVSCISEIAVHQTSSVILAGHQFQNYRPMLPSSIKVDAELELRPHASAMIQMVETQKFPAISALAVEPVYIRDQVTHGGKNG